MGSKTIAQVFAGSSLRVVSWMGVGWRNPARASTLARKGGQPGLEEGDGGQHFREDRFHGLSLSDALIYMNGCYQNWNR